MPTTYPAQAVNMAKALLKTNTLDTSDEGDQEMENMMWAIIVACCVQINFNALHAIDARRFWPRGTHWLISAQNGQNFQIHQMQDYLAEKSYAESDICESTPSMAPIFAPTPRPTPSPTVSPGNPTSAPAPAPTPAPVVVTTPPVALAATEILPAASSSSSGSSDTITTTASGNIIATICVVAAVLIVGAFVAGRRSVKTPAPAREYFGESGRDAVETDKV